MSYWAQGGPHNRDLLAWHALGPWVRTQLTNSPPTRDTHKPHALAFPHHRGKPHGPHPSLGSAEVTAFFQGPGPELSCRARALGASLWAQAGAALAPARATQGCCPLEVVGRLAAGKRQYLWKIRQHCPSTHYTRVVTAGRSQRAVRVLTPAPSDSPFRHLAWRGVPVTQGCLVHSWSLQDTQGGF